jgi:hypothetical protein
MRHEKWLPVPGFVGIYEVSSFGRVKAVAQTLPRDKKGRPRGRVEKIFRLSPGSNGYFTVNLTPAPYVRVCFTVHSLVLTVFVCPRPTGMICNHIDGIKTNNRVENLEWVTYSENIRHAYGMGLRIPNGKKHGSKNKARTIKAP